MNCKNCGSPLMPGAPYCGNCGAPIDPQGNGNMNQNIGRS
jgi:uncharacterized OB-fold protein